MLSHREVGALWERSAQAWTRLARAGFDVYLDRVNTPAFLEMLPDVAGQRGLDIGCGEGHNTRLVLARCASMTAVDISRSFARAARNGTGGEEPLLTGVASATTLPFADATFDFATAFMSLQDVPETEVALREAARVVRPGGFFQFSICHPCSDTPHRRHIRDAEGRDVAIEIGRYFDDESIEIAEWTFSAAPPEARAGLDPFRLPRIHRTLSRWLNAIVDAGFRLERFGEPVADGETAQKWPGVADTQVVPYFLHIRCRKPIVEE